MFLKPESQPTRKQEQGFVAILVVIFIAIAMACGLYYAVSKNKPVDVLEAKKSFDLTEESKEALRTVDNILLEKKDNWQLQERAREDANEKIAATGGDVTWIKRQLAIGVPVTTDLQGASDWVKSKLQGSKVKVISERTAVYNGWDSYRLDLGIEVKAGKGTQTYTTDTIYFFHNGNLTKVDKDIRKPSTQKKPGTTPKKKYSGKLAVIIDDCGYSMDPVRKLVKTGLPFNYAIIPYKPYSSDVLHLVTGAGKVAMLHLPMEPMDASQISEPGHTVLNRMDDNQIRSLVLNAIDTLPGISGVNNHEGSRSTSDTDVMVATLKAIKSRGLFFVDSATSSASVAQLTARRLGVPTGKNLLFLDNVADVESIHSQMLEAAELADRYGTAIVICHARPATATAWTYYGKEIQESGIQMVPVTALVR
jgi:polysaccharide deacetylase 2 family uncharacterized protein YibQ